MGCASKPLQEKLHQGPVLQHPAHAVSGRWSCLCRRPKIGAAGNGTPRYLENHQSEATGTEPGRGEFLPEAQALEQQTAWNGTGLSNAGAAATASAESWILQVFFFFFFTLPAHLSTARAAKGTGGDRAPKDLCSRGGAASVSLRGPADTP